MWSQINFKPMFRIFFRWVDRYPWRFALALVLVGFSLLMATEPSWFIAAIDALRIPYAILLVAAIVFFFIRGIHLLTTASVLSLLILSPDIWPYFKTADELPAVDKAEKQIPAEADLSVLHFNVKEKNKNIASVAEAARHSGADIVSMQELHSASLAAVHPIMEKEYPYSISDVSVPGYGMAIYAKHPIINAEVKKVYDYVFITGYIQIGERVVAFISATTSTPTNEKDYANQIKQFKYITDYANTIDSALIVMGDMNAVPWSDQIKNFMQHTGLKDSRKDLSATYPAQSPFQIPIDYIFHSGEIRCIQFTTVGGTTSNHLGIIGYYNFITGREDENFNVRELIK
jgi:endonuclease/exonuclease/phosphatase (EEP) superfamily protein YafD